jgi:nicotinamide riboside kinase
MKIAFSGSGGTGKTTLLNNLNENLNYYVIKEGIRTWLKQNDFKDFKEMQTDDVIKMQTDVLNAKILQESRYKNFISDRTTIDNFCYCLRWIGSETSNHNDFMKNYFKKSINHAKKYYDLIFILPWNAFKIEDDGVRSNKKWYQYMMQSLIEHHLYGLLLSNTDVKIHKVDSIDLSDRVKECLLVINDLSLTNFKNYEQKESIIFDY